MKLVVQTALTLAFALLVPRVSASPAPPLRPGEELRYSVSWAVVPGAGEILVSAAMSDGQLKITTKTSTRRMARMIMKFDAVAESLYDAKSGRLVSLYERSVARNKRSEHVMTFDYISRKAAFAPIGATTPQFIDLPEGSPSDLISALLETRTWNIKPGEKRDALVIFKDEFYELTIHALRYEYVSTHLGRFRALVLEPRMEKTPPKGMFKRGSTVKVWIAEGERRLPVKFEVEFNIGTGTATLEDYIPPRPTPAAAAPAEAPSGAASGTSLDAKDPVP